ncbi:hypothetical protein [Streptomyces sp. Tue6028]|uniref:hypothetical protein n=1 Tax=Streptomyces sp. Tue6028 TaxID=2036037 RepID=UPI003D70A79F
MRVPFVDVLTASVPEHGWSRAHPCASDHLAHHAAEAGHLDALLQDAEYLLHATSRGFIPYLPVVR